MIQPNLTYLESIAGGDKRFINEMLQMILDNTLPEVEILKTHALNKEWTALGSTAHKMKAPLQMLGIPQISECIIELEQMGKQQRMFEGVGSKILELDALLKEIGQGIEHHLKQA